jgi:putative flippase GtrA
MNGSHPRIQSELASELPLAEISDVPPLPSSILIKIGVLTRKLFCQNTILFGFVGSIGFCVDGGILTLLSQTLRMSLYLSRAFSFTTATLVTWALNRRLTFETDAVSAQQKKGEYLRYLSIQIGGGLLNLGVFSILIYFYPSLKKIPVVPLAGGAIFGMLFNYSGSRYWVFRSKAA